MINLAKKKARKLTKTRNEKWEIIIDPMEILKIIREYDDKFVKLFERHKLLKTDSKM